ncbi:MAG: hypothetical protein FJ399_11555 [Verrucomicrobia bacterium]|nr:hypothetical protein [Verrucomicrobiota bacterium]
MKHSHFATFVSAIALFAASQPMLAAAPKADVRDAAMVAALSAVSPDPLGGRIGLAIASARSVEQGIGRAPVVLGDLDRQAYAVWKASRTLR